MINGELSSKPDAMSNCITQFYKNLYAEVDCHQPLLDGLGFSRLSLDVVAGLEKPFYEEEVAGVVQGFAGDKALGPDGFPMVFFQACWPSVRPDIMEVLQYFMGWIPLRRA
jgi:hypothetical protein